MNAFNLFRGIGRLLFSQTPQEPPPCAAAPSPRRHFKLTADQAREIVDLHVNTKLTHREIAARYGVSKKMVDGICQGRKWSKATGVTPDNAVKRSTGWRITPKMEQTVREIERELVGSELTRAEIATRFGVSKTTVHRISAGQHGSQRP